MRQRGQKWRSISLKSSIRTGDYAWTYAVSAYVHTSGGWSSVIGLDQAVEEQARDRSAVNGRLIRLPVVADTSARTAPPKVYTYVGQLAMT